MAINKTINRSSKSKAGMRNCIEYILKPGKTEETLTYMTGPAPDELNWNNVYNAFINEKQIWNKQGGRLYNHNVISFHKDENITPEEALEFGKEFAEKWFPDHQSVIAVHKDRDHVHIHIVTNTVSYVDGRKLHNSKKDLQKMKDFTNEMCKARDLTIAEKGKHFNGESIEKGELIAWSKDKYNLLNDSSRKSYVTDCAVAILEVLEDICESISDFINAMQDKGWKVNWTDKRKNITFENEKGEKVRDTNISKTFNMNIGKEALIYEFERQKAIREERARAEQEESRRNEELERYVSELDDYIKAAGSNREPEENDIRKRSNDRGSKKTESRSGDDNRGKGRDNSRKGQDNPADGGGTSETDVREFIDNLNTKERASAKERADREAEQRRLDTERQREAERRERESEEKRRKNKKRLRDKTLDLWD